MASAPNWKLESYLAQKLGCADLKIIREWRNTEGWSMETFSLGLSYRKNGKSVEQDIILRREPAAGLLEPYDASIEFRVLDALQHSGIALARTYWYEPDPSVFERPFYVMEKVEGDVHFLTRENDPDYRLIPDDRERASLAADFIENLVRIHTCDWRAAGLDFLGDPGPGRGSALSQVEYWEQVIERAGYRRKPIVSLAVNWLKHNAPHNECVRLVHGDYRTGNYIHRNGRIRAVLDWEMVHLGDPHEDLVYVLGGLWRSPAPTNWVSHLMPEDEFLDKYQEKSGIHVDRQKLDYYQILNDLKAVGITSTAAHAFATGKNLDLRPGVFAFLIDMFYYSLAKYLGKQLRVSQ